jgi:hypothetical protein
MLKAMLRLALVAILCAYLCKSGYGQSAVDGAIGGVVQDESGEAIGGATVVIHSNDTNSEQAVSADASGFYRGIHLQPGTYTVTVTSQVLKLFNRPT